MTTEDYPGVVIVLNPWEDVHAHHVGITVHYANVHKNNRTSYDARLLQPDNDRACIDSARAEVGVARAYGGYWHAGHWDSAQHDLYAEQHADISVRRLVNGAPIEMGIEVKRRRSGHWVPIDYKDYLKNHLLVWAEVHGCDAEHQFPRVKIIGQAHASQVWDHAEPWGNDTKRRKFSPALLQAPAVMKEYI